MLASKRHGSQLVGYVEPVNILGTGMQREAKGLRKSILNSSLNECKGGAYHFSFLILSYLNWLIPFAS